MATFAQMCNAGFATASSTSLLGEAFTMRGTAYTGVIDTSPEMEMFAGGGSIEGTPIVIVMARADAPTPAPGLGEKVVYGGKNYTIRQIDDDSVTHITLIGEAAGKRS